ncbi:unnamed protein product [Arctia plantaginis]|uniref:Uncharacterized protein n=1 Tax=Arctia plantaginis TaxID=874455 RepID=A0A8S1AWR6_ARCPL|nr:unnamed protein product [Arctia plantaginis]CAB3249831.1 unnamed protein product [Arctia plantaginis]
MNRLTSDATSSPATGTGRRHTMTDSSLFSHLHCTVVSVQPLFGFDSFVSVNTYPAWPPVVAIEEDIIEQVVHNL